MNPTHSRNIMMAIVASAVFCGCGTGTISLDQPATEVVTHFWEALERSDCAAAYEWLHPDTKANLSLAQFTNMQTRRRNSGEFPEAMQLVASQRSGDDVVASYQLTFRLPDGSTSAPSGPPRRVIVRKAENTWRLLLMGDFVSAAN